MKKIERLEIEPEMFGEVMSICPEAKKIGFEDDWIILDMSLVPSEKVNNLFNTKHYLETEFDNYNTPEIFKNHRPLIKTEVDKLLTKLPGVQMSLHPLASLETDNQDFISCATMVCPNLIYLGVDFIDFRHYDTKNVQVDEAFEFVNWWVSADNRTRYMGRREHWGYLSEIDVYEKQFSTDNPKLLASNLPVRTDSEADEILSKFAQDYEVAQSELYSILIEPGQSVWDFIQIFPESYGHGYLEKGKVILNIFNIPEDKINRHINQYKSLKVLNNHLKPKIPKMKLQDLS